MGAGGGPNAPNSASSGAASSSRGCGGDCSLCYHPGNPPACRSCLAVKAAFVQPLRKALTQPACALLAATRPRRGSLSWSSPCRSEQPSSAAFCRVRACAEGHGSPPLPASARAHWVTPAPAPAPQGCPEAGVGSPCWPNPAWGVLAAAGVPGGEVPCPIPQHHRLCWCCWWSSKRHGASPRVVGGLSLRGKNPATGIHSVAGVSV